MESVMGSKPEGLGELLSHGLHSRRQQVTSSVVTTTWASSTNTFVSVQQ